MESDKLYQWVKKFKMRIPHASILLNFFTLILFLWLAAGQITNEEMEGDEIENALASYHLATQGFYSLDGVEPFNRREPFPNLLNAANIYLFSSVVKAEDPQEILSNPGHIHELTRINLFYLAALYLSIWFLIIQYTRSHWMVIPAVLFPLIFFTFGSHMPRLWTDLPAAVLITLATGLLIAWAKNPELRNAAGFGIVLGFLTLTKAAGFYLFLIFIILFPIVWIFRKKKQIKNTPLPSSFLVFTLSFLFVITPWMTRNYVQLNEFSITQRGGEVLLIRALKNQMTPKEYKGAFYAYSPLALREAVMGKLLGFDESDLEAGGSLERLNRYLPEEQLALERDDPDALTSYYRIAKYRLPQRIIRDEPPGSSISHEELFIDHALQIIRSDLMSHLQLSFVFAYRGIWANGSTDGLKGHLLWVWNAIAFFSFITLFIIGLIKKDVLLSLLILPGFSYFLFHAAATHFIPRYSVPLIPLMSISVVLLVILIMRMREMKDNEHHDRF